MAKQNLKKDKVLELINKFPKHGTITLAKILYEENNLLFKDLENARSAIRYHSGELDQDE